MSGEGKFLGVVSEFMNNEVGYLKGNLGDDVKIVATSLYEETTSEGYCETCYYESTSIIIIYDIVGKDGELIESAHKYSRYGNMAEFIESLTKY